jgi:hypothetical protein
MTTTRSTLNKTIRLSNRWGPLRLADISYFLAVSGLNSFADFLIFVLTVVVSVSAHVEHTFRLVYWELKSARTF